MLDANTLIPEVDFVDLREIYVIIITENDVIVSNHPIYHIDWIVKEIGKILVMKLILYI